MASNSLIILFSSLVLLPLAFPSITAHEVVEKRVEVVVEGMVYCQSCEHFGTWSLTDAEPIASAQVSVICKDHKKRVSYYKAFGTNGNGYFCAELKDFKMGHSILDHPLQACHVKLVSSPLANCSLLSNVNYGFNGSPFRYEGKTLKGDHYRAVIYAAGPLAFRPANCPPTHS